MDGSSAEMDSSLATLFCDPELEESPDELRHMLMKTTMDLQSIRAQAKLYELELHHLQTLLAATQQERDEAKQEALKLKESFLSGAVIPGISTNNIHFAEQDSFYNLPNVSSSRVQLDCMSSSIMFDPPSAHLPDLHWNLQPQVSRDVQSRDLSSPYYSIPPHIDGDIRFQNQKNDSIMFSSSSDGSFEQEVNQQAPLVRSSSFCEMDKLLPQTVLIEEMNRMQNMVSSDEYLKEHGNYYENVSAGKQHLLNTNQSPEQHLSRQNSVQLSDNIPQPQQLSRHKSVSDLCSQQLNENIAPPQHLSRHNSIQLQDHHLSRANSIQDTHLQNVPNQNHKRAKHLHTSSTGNPNKIVDQALPKHLPEPPESDPQVMLRSLPERGKLLQTVIQAGPLLQTLLVSGSPPQWHQPPPYSAAVAFGMVDQIMSENCKAMVKTVFPTLLNHQ